ncbi:zinc finger protein 594-like isoform X2 [Periplaneta americana]|uniref:zinc finger protein 594-like isoform X2 n=1 Tax=Periplaneta americana TaxID=6978 RepID=UPI0037E94065
MGFDAKFETCQNMDSETELENGKTLIPEIKKECTTSDDNTRQKPTFKCKEPGCKKTYNSKSGLLHHEKRVHCSEPIEYFCYVCSRGFIEKTKLRRHLMVHKAVSEKIVYPCPYDGCTKSFLHERNLTPHIRAFHEGKKFSCTYPDCNKLFSAKCNLEYHLKIHEKKTVSGNVICNVCKKTLKNEENLQRHMMAVHKMSETYYCDKCNRRFKRASKLKKHVAYHEKLTEDDDSLHCNLCNAQFKMKFYLLKHIKDHEDCPEKINCTCNICFKHIMGMTQFQKHMLQHQIPTERKEAAAISKVQKFKNDYKKKTQDAVFTCDLCKRDFKEKSKLVRHMSVHMKTSLRRVYPCTENNCSKQYYTSWGLSYHLKYGHTGDAVENEKSNHDRRFSAEDATSVEPNKLIKENSKITDDPVSNLIKRLTRHKVKELKLKSDSKNVPSLCDMSKHHKEKKRKKVDDNCASISDVVTKKHKKKEKEKQNYCEYSSVFATATRGHKKKKKYKRINSEWKMKRNDKKEECANGDYSLVSDVANEGEVTMKKSEYSFAVANMCEVIHTEIKDESDIQRPKQEETNRLDESSHRLVIVASRKWVSKRNNLEDSEKKRDNSLCSKQEKEGGQLKRTDRFCKIEGQNISTENDNFVSSTITDNNCNGHSISNNCLLQNHISEEEGERQRICANKQEKTHYVQIYAFRYPVCLPQWICMMLEAWKGRYQQ